MPHRAGRRSRRRLEYQVGCHREALESVRRLAPVDVSRTRPPMPTSPRRNTAAAAGDLPDRPVPAPPEGEGLGWAPRRLVRGPAQPEEQMACRDTATRDRWWDFQQRVQKTASAVPLLAEYWADGRRSVAEIAARIRWETGVEATALVAEYSAGWPTWGWRNRAPPFLRPSFALCRGYGKIHSATHALREAQDGSGPTGEPHAKRRPECAD